MKELFTNFELFSQQFEQDHHSYITILQELHVAWDTAQQKALEQIQNDEALTAFEDCFRYAMIASSIDSANSISLDDDYERGLALSVLAGRSSAELKRAIWQYLESILPNIDPEFRVQMMIPFFDAVDEPQNLLEHAKNTIDEISDGYQRPFSRFLLSYVLPTPEKKHCLETALNEIRQYDELKMRAGAMSQIADAMGDKTLKQAISDEIMGFVFDIEDTVSVVEVGSFALAISSPENYPTITEKMLPLMESITKVRNYLEVAPLYLAYIDEDARQMLLKNIDKALDELTAEYSFSAMVASVYEHFADYQKEVIRERILAMQFPTYRGRALGAINAASDPTLIKTVRHTLLEYLMALRHADRAQLFFMMSLPNLVTPTLLGDDVFKNVVISCIDICRDWDIQSENS